VESSGLRATMEFARRDAPRCSGLRRAGYVTGFARRRTDRSVKDPAGEPEAAEGVPGADSTAPTRAECWKPTFRLSWLEALMKNRARMLRRHSSYRLRFSISALRAIEWLHCARRRPSPS
jgi:hypothetical protein